MSRETNSVRESIDKIEPSEGARERMLRNIKMKAAEQQKTAEKPKPENRKVLTLNRIAKWALPVAACLAIAIVGIRIVPDFVSPGVESDSGIQLANPFAEVQSSAEFEKQLGIAIDAPNGSENTAYFILDGSIANINFEYGGRSYTLRASKQSGDFSGVNGTLIKSDKIDAENDALLETIRGEFNYYKLIWTDGAVKYILVNNSETFTDDIIGIYELVK